METIDALIDAIISTHRVDVQSSITVPIGDEASRRKAFMAHLVVDGAEYSLAITPTDLGE